MNIMRFYAIKDNNLFTALNKNALAYYGDAKELPDDYEQDKYIVVDNELVLNPEWEKEHLDKAKQAKVQENDTVRDTALNAGVVHKDVLFDSDTDQKVNLLATVSMMGDEDTITWFGKDNHPLNCTKEDLLNIGNLIIQLHSFCWNKNALIKNEIAEAATIEELDAIEINYELLAIETVNGSNGGEQAS